MPWLERSRNDFMEILQERIDTRVRELRLRAIARRESRVIPTATTAEENVQTDIASTSSVDNNV